MEITIKKQAAFLLKYTAYYFYRLPFIFWGLGFLNCQ